jgi:hypothetical protein
VRELHGLVHHHHQNAFVNMGYLSFGNGITLPISEAGGFVKGYRKN